MGRARSASTHALRRKAHPEVVNILSRKTDEIRYRIARSLFEQTRISPLAGTAVEEALSNGQASQSGCFDCLIVAHNRQLGCRSTATFDASAYPPVAKSDRRANRRARRELHGRCPTSGAIDDANGRCSVRSHRCTVRTSRCRCAAICFHPRNAVAASAADPGSCETGLRTGGMVVDTVPTYDKARHGS
jgi:hypothetical protein